jgi:two-component system chemotaxis response regulator CheY
MSRKVLVVDDSKTTRDMIMFTLRRAGYEVMAAEDGQEALAMLGGNAVGCVITDLNMPVMDGLELIRELRASKAHQDTPILMLTTQTDADKKVLGQQAGATGWLSKPFHPETLVETLKRVL